MFFAMLLLFMGGFIAYALLSARSRIKRGESPFHPGYRPSPGTTSPTADPGPGISTPNPCFQCNGTGKLPCTVCAGRGSWWEQSSSATGGTQLMSCTFCTSSGHVSCQSCGGSGRSR